MRARVCVCARVYAARVCVCRRRCCHQRGPRTAAYRARRARSFANGSLPLRLASDTGYRVGGKACAYRLGAVLLNRLSQSLPTRMRRAALVVVLAAMYAFLLGGAPAGAAPALVLPTPGASPEPRATILARAAVRATLRAANIVCLLIVLGWLWSVCSLLGKASVLELSCWWVVGRGRCGRFWCAVCVRVSVCACVRV